MSMKMTEIRLSPTSLSQYIRLENCERYLRFRICPEDEKRLRKKWNITIQPLTPLLKEAGSEFEQNVAEKIAAHGETVINLDGEGIDATQNWLRDVKSPTILFQPTLEAPMGKYHCSGRADVIRLSRDYKKRLKIIVADIKATRNERMEHRLQVANYVHLLLNVIKNSDISLASIQGNVLTMGDDGEIPSLDPAEPSFDLDTYLSLLERLVIGPDSVVDRIVNMPFAQLFFHLNYKCDGCLYNQICMYDTAERMDLSLTPYLTAIDKRVLNKSGVTTLPALASLMDLPTSGSFELTPAPKMRAQYDQLVNLWPVGPRLPSLVQRAKRGMKNFDTKVPAKSFLYGSGFGTLPNDEDHPNLVKIYFDTQHDYLKNRIYLISGLVTGPNGDRIITKHSNKPPTNDSELGIIREWVYALLRAIQEVSGDELAHLHFYCYNRYDQKILLAALKRHLDQVASIPAFFDLMTQSPALSQPIISFLSDEIQERLNLGLLCAPLHDAARRLGFNWQDKEYEFYRIFRARVFDNRRRMIRDHNGGIRHAGQDIQRDDPRILIIESASRFNSQIPLEYVYAAWDCLPDVKEDRRILEPFRSINLKQLVSFAEHRVRALEHIENSFKLKSRYLNKEPLRIPIVNSEETPSDLGQSMQDFLYMEHHTSLQNKLINYSLPIDRRVQTGLALLLKYVGPGSLNFYRFNLEFETIGLDRDLAMNALRLKEGAWVVVNKADQEISANRIKNGRLAIIKGIDRDEIELDLLGVTFYRGKFRYWHENDLEPASNQFYTLDEMADDLNGDKTLEALINISNNTFYQWLLHKPSPREIPDETQLFFDDFVQHINAVLAPRKIKLTKPQEDVIATHLDEPLVLVQGPPGTGKSYTLAWAILAHIAHYSVLGKPCRVAISCKTHNSVKVVLKALSELRTQLTGFAFAKLGGQNLRNLEIFKISNDASEDVPKDVTALETYKYGSWNLENLISNNLIVIAGTSGGLYNFMKHRDAGGKKVDWNLKTFDLVVVDEASQASLPEGVLSCAFLKPDGKVIVVGDHRQMPPIISHPWAEEEKRNIIETRPYLSLFESLIERDFPNIALDESFRLHKQIAEFLQENIYIKDGINFHSKKKDLINPLPQISPYVNAVMNHSFPIVVVEHSEQSSQQYNELEIELTKPLIEACTTHLGLDGLNGVGVVVPHRAQKALLREHFPKLAVTDSIDTVERFQGDERDVIIVTATASDPDYVRTEADFLLNLNRLNVAISRPRKKLVVIASRSVIDLLVSDLDVFENSVIWKRLYHHYTPDLLYERSYNGFSVRVRGRKAG